MLVEGMAERSERVFLHLDISRLVDKQDSRHARAVMFGRDDTSSCASSSESLKSRNMMYSKVTVLRFLRL